MTDKRSQGEAFWVLVLLALIGWAIFGYGVGYKNGQVDYAKGKIKYQKIKVSKWMEVSVGN